MARQQLVIMTDDITGEDITGKPGAGTVPFAIDGIRYEIDLSASERDKLRDLMKPYVKAGRRVTGVVRALPSVGRGPARTDPRQLQEQRRWWRENYKVLDLREPSDKGRIPREVVAAYLAHDGKKVHKKVDSPFAA
ncbi:Lsr2 family protein [Micromonospora sp. NPDC047730]|uniref:histone-like nucleoid-structuring protein Lsr2 n=1 Tax=Micromonospora sp. NPDC047730 TaxID=3364253 RepID=UPI00371A5463